MVAINSPLKGFVRLTFLKAAPISAPRLYLKISELWPITDTEDALSEAKAAASIPAKTKHQLKHSLIQAAVTGLPTYHF